jgi:anti-sigma B factor antagonist
MKEDAEPAFLVNPESDPILIRIRGKANYLNSAPLGNFFRHMISRGNRRFVVDFSDCAGMDSTFLGIIAGTAIQLKQGAKSSFILTRLSTRNLELVQNLGLDRLLTVDKGGANPELLELEEGSAGSRPQELAPAVADDLTILRAHEALSSIDANNARKFQDVVTFLRQQVSLSGED